MPNPNVDLRLGSPVLPEQVKRVRTDGRGAVTFYVDTEDHDLDLLASVAEAVAEHPEFVDALKRYAEIRSKIDTAEVTDNHPLRRSLEDEAVDLLADVTSWMDVEPGEDMPCHLRPEAADALARALVGEVVSA